MAGVVPAQLAADIDVLIRASKQRFIKRNIDIDDIPHDELDVLCKYFPLQLLVEMFGGHYQVLLKAFIGRMNEKSAIEAQKKSVEKASQEENFESKDPAGIGNWNYAERLKLKVLRSLEMVINMGVGTAGNTQYVQSAKTLLAEALKTKEEAASVMMAYEAQLIVLAEHLVEIFLPKLGDTLKSDMRKTRDDVLKRISAEVKGDKYALNIFKAEINKVVRTFGLKRFELLLAETMAKNQQVCEAFDFTKDLIKTYRQQSRVLLEDKNANILKTHINSRA